MFVYLFCCYHQKLDEECKEKYGAPSTPLSVHDTEHEHDRYVCALYCTNPKVYLVSSNVSLHLYISFRIASNRNLFSGRTQRGEQREYGFNL